MLLISSYQKTSIVIIINNDLQLVFFLLTVLKVKFKFKTLNIIKNEY